ncbi:hypothetical protein U1Q18_035328 [Sarracenia purpurea var. burkii]
MVTVATKGAPPSASKPESLTHIDIRKLSQSELHALSLCSDAAFDLRCTDDVVTPQIDRNLFNESAGSRRQTYSRPRHPDSSNSAGHRSRLPGLLPNPRPLPTLAPDDPERAENKSIVNFLKQLINRNEIENSPADPLLLPPLPPQQPVVSDNPQTVPQSINRGTEVGSGAQDMQIVVYSGEKKRKRGRQSKPPEVREDGGEIRLEIVNKNGVAVDLKALENADELYAAELRTRTAGLETEEGVLGVLRNLEGQWGSRRKKRKIVDAGEFGDSMPIGWKLLLGLKRREGRVSIYCRRYIRYSSDNF